jgi:hypothetical protein
MTDRAHNSIRGRKAKAAGDLFEMWLEQQHTIALRLGILACIEHNQAKAEMKGGRLIYTAPGIADYTGVFDRCGTAAAIEAKSTKDTRLMKSAVSPEQQDYLGRVARAGGFALLAVEFRSDTGFQRFAAPWTLIKWQVLRTAESVSAIELAEWSVGTCGESYLARFHPPGTPSTLIKVRQYARE